MWPHVFHDLLTYCVFPLDFLLSSKREHIATWDGSIPMLGQHPQTATIAPRLLLDHNVEQALHLGFTQKMYLFHALLIAYGLSEAAAAFKLPFYLPWVNARSNEQVPLALPQQEDTTSRIAIIGAGAGGSSAAFWIGKAKERYGLDIEVDIYDSNPYIGGREWCTPVDVRLYASDD